MRIGRFLEFCTVGFNGSMSKVDDAVTSKPTWPLGTNWWQSLDHDI
jgi:hypothetical protein